MCLLPPSGPRHSAGLFYCPVVKCHLGSHVSGGVLHPSTKLVVNIMQRHLSRWRRGAGPFHFGKWKHAVNISCKIYNSNNS